MKARPGRPAHAVAARAQPPGGRAQGPQPALERRHRLPGGPQGGGRPAPGARAGPGAGGRQPRRQQWGGGVTGAGRLQPPGRASPRPSPERGRGDSGVVYGRDLETEQRARGTWPECDWPVSRLDESLL